MLKHVFQHDYLIVQDFDEVIAFDQNSFSSLSEAVSSSLSLFGEKYTEIMIADTVIYHDCFPKAPKLDYSDVVISKAEYALRNGLHVGKTIHSTKSCILLFAHYCAIARRSDILTTAPKILSTQKRLYDLEVGLKLNMNLRTVQPKLMRSFHFRMPVTADGKKALYLNRSDICNVSNYNYFDWLIPIKEQLEHRTRNTMDIVQQIIESRLRKTL